MMAVGQVQPTKQQLRLFSVVSQQLLLFRRKQAHDRREVVFLVKVKEHFAVLRVFDDDRFTIAVCRRGQWCHEQDQQRQTTKNGAA